MRSILLCSLLLNGTYQCLFEVHKPPCSVCCSKLASLDFCWGPGKPGPNQNKSGYQDLDREAEEGSECGITVSAVSMYIKYLAEIRPALKTWVLKCSAAPPHVVYDAGGRGLALALSSCVEAYRES